MWKHLVTSKAFYEENCMQEVGLESEGETT